MVEEQTLQILTELETTIASYGKRAGYDLILKVDSGGGPTEGGGELVEHFQERIFRAQISDVLFFKDTLDVTKRVLDYLNSKGNLAKMERQAAERKRGRRGGKPQPQGADKPK